METINAIRRALIEGYPPNRCTCRLQGTTSCWTTHQIEVNRTGMHLLQVQLVGKGEPLAFTSRKSTLPIMQ